MVVFQIRRIAVLAVDALGVDLVKHGHAVSSPLGDPGRGNASVEHVDAAACRRAYGTSFRGEAASMALGAELVSLPEGEIEADRIEWVPMAGVPGMIVRRDIWTCSAFTMSAMG
ncbi:hypothetical protein [Spongiactinospora gelatinilytica]|uniref:hypothetical protein n=1 Tax=Spongiactinospora gelatinilytica TaxID=2666298 RepID=UPI0018F31EA9|nr:hypothetical protein [Spongiactinospora gelatinilytica]